MNQDAFTLSHKDSLRELMTRCRISPSFHSESKIKQYKAIWDTGATGCVISDRVAKDLELQPIGMQRVVTPSTPEPILVNAYLINIFLPNEVEVHFIRATEGILKGFDVLIGMDIISRGDFAITHKNGGTTFSFQMPPTYDIDFRRENAIQHTNSQVPRWKLFINLWRNFQNGIS